MRYAVVRIRQGLFVTQEWFADRRRWNTIAAGSGSAMRAALRLLSRREEG